MEMRKNPLILATALVFGFWWLISLTYLWLQEGEVYLYMGPLYWGVQIFLFFFLLTLAARSLVRLAIKRGIKGEKYRGAIITIGILPYDEPIRSKFKLVKPCEVVPKQYKHLRAWIQNCDQNSTEYQLFKRIISLLYANKHVPASPVKGGHGGLSVFEHTLNVLNVGLERIESWKVSGVSTKDPIYEQSVPHEYYWIAVLCLAAHDLGKINAYKIEKDGTVTIAIRHHDKESVRMLSDMAEYWELSKDDRFILNAVVAHGHSKEYLPTRIGVVGRVILSFVVDIDHIVSARESEAGGDIFASDEQIDEVRQTESKELADFVLDLLAEPGRVNGNDDDMRLAFKAGTRLFIHEQKLAKVVAEEFYDDPILYEQTTGDGRRKITEKILYALDQRGLLVKEHKGKTFNYKAALFKAQAYNPKKETFLPRNSKNIGGWPAVIVINISFDETPLLISMSNAPFPPRIISPVLAQKSTSNYSDEDSGRSQDTDVSAGEEEASVETTEENEASEASEENSGDSVQKDFADQEKEAVGQVLGSSRGRRGGRSEASSVLMEEIPESALDDVVIGVAAIKPRSKKSKKKKPIEQDSGTKQHVKQTSPQAKSSLSQQKRSVPETEDESESGISVDSEEIEQAEKPGQVEKPEQVLSEDESPALKALKRRKKRMATGGQTFNPDDLSSLSMLIDDLPHSSTLKDEEGSLLETGPANSQKQQGKKKHKPVSKNAETPVETESLCKNCGKVTLKLLEALKSLAGGVEPGEVVLDAEEFLLVAKQAGYAQSYKDDEFYKYADFVAHSIDEGRPAVRGIRYVRTEEGGIDYFVVNA